MYGSALKSYPATSCFLKYFLSQVKTIADLFASVNPTSHPEQIKKAPLYDVQPP